MSEYFLIGMVSTGVMFLFAYMGFEIIKLREGDRWNQVLGLLLILTSLIVGWSAMGMNVSLAEDLTPTHDITASTNGGYFAVIIAGWLTFGYFLFRILFGSLYEAKDALRNRGEGGGR